MGEYQFAYVSLLFRPLNVGLTLTWTFPPATPLRRQVKQIAGNIIPAIATTNAIVAGGQVMEAIKIIRGLDIRKHCKYTYVFHIEHTKRPPPSCLHRVCEGSIRPTIAMTRYDIDTSCHSHRCRSLLPPRPLASTLTPLATSH